MATFEPIFANLPDEPLAEWTALRRFLGRWYGAALPAVGRVTRDVAGLEEDLGRTLPTTVREWLALTDDLARAEHRDLRSLLRDGRSIAPLPEHDALSLNLQAEGDVHWAIPLAALDEADPPVHGYARDWNAAEERFGRATWLDCASVTVFAFSFLLGYLRSANELRRRVELAPIGEALGVEGFPLARLGSLAIAEGPGWVALLESGGAFGRDPTVRVLLSDPDAVELPQALAGLR
ncbi:MAG TPA: hypothetical protein RMH85_21365 [Polyangiaceae bacterium LLY-WYZ-15_(1-7)]|nr:hypothetical protein [Myxococcales bacterium]MAT29394.1 hypothetical protein [Sandaracinus sp.]HJL00378.1 hypothetical protein [Polyangiaceae bacterium LLY-WYZ-15_(1-7)]MBJ70234.1 hypothetical protein [Sandaracinus sp.]HJL11039.1 hypothetical protein [Polyangiaceae bacterium LLY-WYZ-15_(1-7)]